MPERKINLYGILEKDEALFQDVIDGELSYTIAKSIIYEWMKEACRQTLELATDNATLLEDGEDIGKEYLIQAYDTFYCDVLFTVNKQSILDTINQIG